MNNEATTKFFIYFSQILGREVVDHNNRCVGTLCDIAMKMNSEIYPKAAFLILKKGFVKKKFAQLNWDEIEELGEIIKLKTDLKKVAYESKRIKHDFSLCIDILDQQIVDINNRKVVRVNDVHLLRVENHLYLAHVDVGSRGLIRRLGWTKGIDRIIKFFSPHSPYLHQEELISWKNTQLLNLGRVKNVLRLDVTQQKLSQIHPMELVEIMKDLDTYEQCHLFRSLDVVVQRKVFAGLATIKQAELIEQLDEKEAASLIENIPSDEAADLLLKLPRRKTLKLMKVIETKTSKKLSRLLGFSKNSAGGLMTTEFISLPQNALVKDALQKVKENVQSPANIYHIYLVDEEQRLVGATALRHIISVDLETPLLQTCYPHKIFVHTDDGMEKVALLLEKYKISAIPVVNGNEILQGIITIDDVMEELISMAWKKYKEKL